MKLIALLFILLYIVCIRFNIQILCSLLNIDERELERGNVGGDKLRYFPFAVLGFIVTPILLILLWVK